MLAIQGAEITARAPSKTRPADADRPIWHLALAWVLMIPMLYIAANGILIPPTGQDIAFAATGGSAESSPLHKVSVACVCLIWSALIASRLSETLALSRRMKIMLAFPLVAILSAAWSEDPRQSIVSGLVLFIFTMFAIYLGSRFSFEKQLELIMMAGAIALPVSFLLILFVPSIGTMGATGWRGMFAHKQNCSAVCTLLLITALHRKCFGFCRQAFRAAFILMCLVLLVMSQSRTGWALALVALLLWAAIRILQKMPDKQAAAIVLVAIPMLAAAAYGIHLYSTDVLTSVGKDPTLSQRTIIWNAAWDAILQHPLLGYGFAAFWKGLYGPSQGIVLIAGWGLAQAQDGFLDVWLQIGAVGVALVAFMTLQAAQSASRCFHSEDHEAYVRWCVVVIACTSIYNIGESTIGFLTFPWFLFLIACIGVNRLVQETAAI